MNYLLSINPEDYNTNLIETNGSMETLLFGAQVVLLGMLTVFAVLIILWAALALFRGFFGHKSADKVVTVSEPAPATPVASTNDEELIAVIAAAIAMAESEAPTGVKFRVVGFKRK